MTDPETGSDLIEVRLLNLSVSAYAATAAHHDELRREFTLIAAGAEENTANSVPARLLALTDELNRRFGSFTSASQATLEAAVARGDREIDVVYRLPPQAGPAAAEFGDLLDEADAYCRAGQHLLTLATPPREVAFRRWFLGEFDRQCRGEPAQPWREPAAPS